MKEIYLIAEIGQAHEGSAAITHAMIDALSETGVNAVKFQVHIADAESSCYEQFRVPIQYENGSRTDYWKRMEFRPEEWAGFKMHCERVGLDFIASPFSMSALKILTELDLDTYKIASGEMQNFLMLREIARLEKNIILSTGLSHFAEIDQTIRFLRAFPSSISVLQCTTAYPTQPAEWGLNVMQEFKSRYGLPVGLSDHSGNIFACLAAAALGAEILEFHVTLSKQMPGPDTIASLTIDQIKALVSGVREIELALANPINKQQNAGLISDKQLFGKTLAVNKALTAGSVLTLSDLETRKPAGYGIEVTEFENCVGRPLKKGIAQWDFLTHNHI